MSDKLQQAIQATRVGDKKNAQFLLTQAIQEEPDNPQSWYLLSLLVDDEEKKKMYLSQVLNLDPDHARASQQMLILTETGETAVPEEEAAQEEATVILSSDSPDLEAQDEGATIPDWMAEDLPPAKADEETVAAETAVVAEAEPVPEWLKESVEEDWDKEKVTTAAPPVTKAKKPKKIATQPDAKQKQITKKEPATQGMNEQIYNYLLIILVIIAVVVLIILAYMFLITM
ncbi:MAG: hypothetical protein CSA11_10650 [Chloroflexi bacterium]|nr:MAG: hypothetical protein CSA11_10650 [Chloroflexota bacterium]